jgi:putative DNA primase/helicase
MDPHKLARHYTKKFCTDALGRKTLRHYHGEFWRYEDGRYRALPQLEVFASVTKAIKRLVDEVPLVDQFDRAYRVTKGTIANVINALASELFVSNTIDQPCWLAPDKGHSDYLAMRNGLLDLSIGSSVNNRGTLKPLTPSWFSGVRLPYDYEPLAKCPRWLAFLDRVLEGDEERIQLLQEWCGYLLTPDTSLQRFLVLEGEGANGKSVIVEVVEALVGYANVSHVPLEVFGDRFQLTVTVNKLVNIAPEVNETARLNEGVLKQFTGGDSMYHDKKGVQGFDTKPTARLMVTTNNRPSIGDRSDGLWRRMKLLPFRVQIPVEEQDPHLRQKLEAEIAGILNWALVGLRSLRQRGHFIEPEVCKAAERQYRGESNPAGIFLREECHLDSGARTRVDVLYRTYAVWAKANGHTLLNNAQFGKEVSRKCPLVQKVRPTEPDGSRPWVYQGLALGPESEASKLDIAA